jgi:cell division protein FtsI (penicillin-binding protein 3)
VKLTGINIKEGIVPHVLGMGAKDAVYLLENAGLQVNLSGAGRVVSQSLPSGQPVQKGKTIAITLK